VPLAIGAAALCALVMLIGAGSADAAYPAKLRTTSTAIVDGEGARQTLRGFNVMPIWADSPGGTWGPEHYRQMKAKGFNTARLVLYWSDFEPSRGRFNTTHLATLDKAIANARAAGVYVVLDMVHLYDGQSLVPGWARSGNNIRDINANADGYIRKLAVRYRDNPAVAAYDPVNEPDTWPVDQNRILRMYDSIIDQIRAVDADKIVMVEPAYGDSDIRGANFGLVGNKRNVVYSLHDYYAGGAGDGYGSDLLQQGNYVWDDTKGYPAPNASELEQHLLVHVRKAQAVGIPLWIGEFAINPAKVNAGLWIDQKISLFKKYRLGYAWWDYRTGSGGHAAIDPYPSYAFKPFVERIR
jgi:hypothetical protein